MTGYMTIIQKVVDGEVQEEIRNFRKSKFVPIKHPVKYSTCQTCGYNHDGCENQNNCNGRDEYIGRKLDVTV